MAKHNIKKEEILTGRISILFFYTLLMAALTRILRFAHGRYDLVFRSWLPWLMPILLVLCIGGLVLCARAARKNPEKDTTLFSASFGGYLLAAPILCLVLPCIFVFVQTEALGMFKLATRLSVCLLMGYFAAYTVSCKVKPEAGRLAWLAAAQIACIYYYFTTQMARSTAFIPPMDGLTPVSSGLLMAALVLMMTLLVRKAEPLLKWVPAGLSVFFLLLTMIVDFSFSLREILLYVYCGLQLVWFVIACVMLKKKK